MTRLTNTFLARNGRASTLFPSNNASRFFATIGTASIRRIGVEFGCDRLTLPLNGKIGSVKDVTPSLTDRKR